MKSMLLIKQVVKRLPCNGFIRGLTAGSFGWRNPSQSAHTRTAGPVRCLSQTPSATSDLNQRSLLDALTAAKDADDMVAFTKRLKRALTHDPLTPPKRLLHPALLQLLQAASDCTFTTHTAVAMASVLQQLGCQVNHPAHSVLIYKTFDILCQQPEVSVFHLTSAIESFAGCGVKLSSLSEATQAALLTIVTAQMNPATYARLLDGLGLLRAHWPKLPLLMQQRVLELFVTLPRGMSANSLTTILQAFGAMGLDANSLTLSQQRAVLSAARLCLKEGDLNNDVLLNALSKMNWQYAALPSEFAAHLVACMSSKQMYLKHPQVLSSVVASFGYMAWPWDALSTDLQHIFLDAFAVSMTSEDPFRSFSFFLTGLGRMGVPWSAVPALHPAIMRAFKELLQKPACKDVWVRFTNSLQGMSLMGLRWAALDKSLRGDILAAYEANHLHRHPQHICTFITALQGMGAQFADLEELLPTVEEFVTFSNESLSSATVLTEGRHIRPAEVVQLIAGLQGMGAYWDQLPGRELDTLIAHLAADMSTQELIQSLHSMAVMEGSLAGMKSAALRAVIPVLEAAVTSMSAQELTGFMQDLVMLSFDLKDAKKLQVAHGVFSAVLMRFKTLKLAQRDSAFFFEVMASTPDGKDLLTNEMLIMPPSPLVKKPQKDVHRQLSSALTKALQGHTGQFHVLNAFEGQDCTMDVDIAIFRDRKLLAFVEIDNSEALRPGSSKQVKRLITRKDFQYAQHYPEAKLYRLFAERIESKGPEAVTRKLVENHLIKSIEETREEKGRERSAERTKEKSKDKSKDKKNKK